MKTMAWFVILLLLFLALVTRSLAFHDELPVCASGQSGYLAVVPLDDGAVAFLSTTPEPEPRDIVCQLDPAVQLTVGTLQTVLVP